MRRERRRGTGNSTGSRVPDDAAYLTSALGRVAAKFPPPRQHSSSPPHRRRASGNRLPPHPLKCLVVPAFLQGRPAALTRGGRDDASGPRYEVCCL
jgi:hypothetical protein